MERTTVAFGAMSLEKVENKNAISEPAISLNYPPLDNAQSQFRMLALEPSPDFNADIKVHVHNRSQHRNPSFEALSYRWGDPEDTVPILVRLTSYQGEERSPETPYVQWPVTRNLEQALRALRLHDEDRLLWVDALCINQNDIVEKGHQVGIMGKIYLSCTRDLLWLGPGAPQICRAMKLVPRIQGHGESGHEATCKAKVDESERTTFSQFSEQDWDDLKSLILHPEVWDRVWIIQELILSPDFTLVCGTEALDWKCIDSVLDDNLDILRQFDTPGPIPGKLQELTMKVSTIRTYRMPAEITNRLFNKSLLSTYFWFLDWKASDMRDKVYAILSLATDGKELDVDYGKTMDELSVDFAKLCLAQGNVRLLSHNTNYCFSKSQYLAQHPPHTTETEHQLPRRQNWPSWIPDLSDSIVTAAKIPGLSVSGVSKYHACSSIPGMTTTNYHISSSLQLSIFGVYVDSVSFVNTISLISENVTPRERWIRDVRSWCPEEAAGENALKDMYVLSDSDSKNESVVTAYWRTVVTDRRLDKRLTSTDLTQRHWYKSISEACQEDFPEELVVLAGWRFGKSNAGMYAMFPPQAKTGDVICVPLGGQVPLLLRQKEGDGEGTFELIGEAYVHGIMDGMGIVRAMVNMHKMMQEDPNHEFEHVHSRLEEETKGKQFYMKMFNIV